MLVENFTEKIKFLDVYTIKLKNIKNKFKLPLKL